MQTLPTHLVQYLNVGHGSISIVGSCGDYSQDWVRRAASDPYAVIQRWRTTKCPLRIRVDGNTHVIVYDGDLDDRIFVYDPDHGIKEHLVTLRYKHVCEGHIVKRMSLIDACGSDPELEQFLADDRDRYDEVNDDLNHLLDPD